MDLRKEKNFFETRVTEYKTGGSCSGNSESDATLHHLLPAWPRPVAEAIETLDRELSCALCGNTFTCKRWIGCWCQSVPVSKERLRALKNLTNDCICPACLRDQKWPALGDQTG